MPRVTEDDVLLLWRALRAFRSGNRPGCAPRGRPRASACPLFEHCPRWGEESDQQAILTETAADTERRRGRWPCSRLLELLSPELTRIGP
jgi:hypothetical protein